MSSSILGRKRRRAALSTFGVLALGSMAVAQVAAGPLWVKSTGGSGGAYVVHTASSVAPFVGVSGANDGTTIGVRADGTAIAWGIGPFGQYIAGHRDIAAASSSGGSTVGLLMRDGSVAAWSGGANVTPPSDLAGVKQIATGDSFVVALKYTGEVVAWGSPYNNELNVPPDLGFTTQIAACGSHGLALQGDGVVKAWGSNTFGESSVPPGLAAKYVAAGPVHSLAITTDGAVVAWGLNNFGQCDVPAEFSPSNPGHTQTLAVAAGDSFSLALRADGTVAAWGSNQFGQLNVPVGLHASTIAGGNPGACIAITPEGEIVTWGNLATPNFDLAQSVGGGYSFLAGVRKGGGLAVVGSLPPAAGYGNVLPALEGVGGLREAASGPDYLVLLAKAGTVTAHGANNYGQCDIPAGLTNLIDVSAGHDHVLGLRGNGEVVAWGSNYNGQRNVPFGIVAKQVEAGYGFSAALLKTGKVVAWGGNSLGESTVPATLKGVTQISCGERHTLALKADGTVAAWGDNYYHECDVPAGLNNVAQVAAGQGLSLALKSDGTLVQWGGGYDAGHFSGSGLAFVSATQPYSFSQINALNRVSITPKAWQVDAGNGANVTLWLPTVATGGGVDVALTSEDPALTVPATVHVPAGQDKVLFTVQANNSSETKTVYFKASFGGAESLATLTVKAPSVSKVTIPSKLASLQQGTGQVYLLKPAPVGGVTVYLAGYSGAGVPSSVIVPAGAASATFTVTGNDVTIPGTATVVASAGGANAMDTMAINPNSIASFTMSPASVVGGSATTVTATITFDYTVAQDTVVTFSSYNPVIQLPPSVTVPAGSKSVSFTVTHHAVGAKTTVYVSAIRGPWNKSSSLTVKP